VVRRVACIGQLVLHSPLYRRNGYLIKGVKDKQTSCEVNSSEKVSAEGNVRALFLVNHIHAPSHNSNRSMKHVSAPF
jgi:hydrogenase maturation factor